MSTPVRFVMMLILIVGVFIAQIWLCRGKRRVPGLILPGVVLIYSIVALVQLAQYNAENNWLALAATFLLTNIPTAILLVIYFAGRQRQKEKDELEQICEEDMRK